jgi:glycosyltransferase involved in cell wall biosynthesis
LIRVIIGIDGTCMQGARTGAGWYLTHLLEAISHHLEEDKLVVWMNNPTPEERARVPENRFISVNATHYPWTALKMTWNTLGTPTMESLLGRPADICFYPNYLPLPQKQGKQVLFVHDLAYLTNPEWGQGTDFKNFKKNIEKQESKVDLILTCSEFNRQELTRQFAELADSKIRVIPHGLSKEFSRPAPAERVQRVKAHYQLNHPYFLFVGTLEPRKNLLRLVHAFLLFKQRHNHSHELILAGPKGWIGEDFLQFIQAPALAQKVRWIQYVASEDLPALYTGAEAFVFPSLKEGFGLPLLEAMGCGAPVVASNSAAIPEVVGDAALLVEPTSIQEWYLAFEKILDPALAADLKRKGQARISLFRWDHSASQTLAAFKMLAGPRR